MTAPSDQRPHAPWTKGRIFLAYTILFALAAVSIWFINRRVDAVANLP